MLLEDTVWLLSGLTGRERGVLRFSRQRFVFVGEKGTSLDVPASEIGGVTFPWHYFGGGMKVQIAGVKYRFSFIEPHNHDASIIDARTTGKRWKAALSSGIVRP